VNPVQRYLVLYSLLITVIFIGTSFWFYRTIHSNKINFKEIDVQQIKVLEPDGTLRMVISNHSMLPGIIVHGKEQAFDRPQAGMLFYNDEGTENGGLIFSGMKNAKGEVVNSGGSLSFDRYGGNQEVQLLGVNDHEDRLAGLIVSDSPPEKQGHRRIWVGRSDDGSSSIALMDSMGRKRIQLQVMSDGSSNIIFLNDRGEIIRTINPISKP